MQARRIDLTRPGSWEFSGFSQNGEDGIIDVLCSQLKEANRYFIEIGASDGIENNTAWLLVAEKYNGIMIEGNPRLVERARRVVEPYSIGAECRNMFITLQNVGELVGTSCYRDPDVFSLDIDGNDYYIAKAILDGGLRPKIIVVEYNSVFGPERSMTVEYRDNFSFIDAHTSQLYYGVSISGWRNFFERYGYRFVTIGRNGVNGFFVDPQCFTADFLDGVKGVEFEENRYQLKKFGFTNEKQFELIADCPFVTI